MRWWVNGEGTRRPVKNFSIVAASAKTRSVGEMLNAVCMSSCTSTVRDLVDLFESGGLSILAIVERS